MCTTGAAHVVPDPRRPNDGSYIGFLGCAPKQTKIAQINVPQFSYCHSFSVTKKFVIVIAEPYYIDEMALVLGKTVTDAFYTNTSRPTTFYVVNIESGKITAIEAAGFVFIHPLNAFEKD